MAEQPLVTIYIPCHNYGKYLSMAIDSVIRQLYTHWELFVVDEGSMDDTVAVAEAKRRLLPTKIFLHCNQKSIGLQKVANYVLAQSHGKYIMRLDADDWLDESALLIMVAKLEQNPQVGIVFGNYYYTNLKGEVLGIERRHRFDSVANVAYQPPHGACTMVDVRSLKSVGGYSEDIKAQDGWELWYKLLRRVEVAQLDMPVFYYRQHGESLSRNKERLLHARSKIIKRISQGLSGGYQISCLAVVGVRESYPSVSDVPYKKVGDKSILALAIEAATNSVAVTDVVVSSSSERVLEFAKELETNGHVKPHRRLKRNNFAGSGIPVHEIMLQAGHSHKEQYGTFPDVVAFLSIHAICRRSTHIDQALDVMKISGSDSVVSVCEERDPLFSLGETGLELLNPGRLQDLAYDNERYYRYNGGVIAVWWEVLMAGLLLGEKICYLEMSLDESTQFAMQSLN